MGGLSYYYIYKASTVKFSKPDALIVVKQLLLKEMKKVNKQCLLDTPRTVRVSEKTWQVIVRTRRP